MPLFYNTQSTSLNESFNTNETNNNKCKKSCKELTAIFIPVFAFFLVVGLVLILL